MRRLKFFTSYKFFVKDPPKSATPAEASRARLETTGDRSSPLAWATSTRANLAAPLARGCPKIRKIVRTVAHFTPAHPLLELGIFPLVTGATTTGIQRGPAGL